MADFLSSQLLAFQSRVSQKFAEKELREQQNPILAAALSYSDFIVDNPAAIKQSERRSVNAYYLKKRTATNGTARAYNHSGTQGDSVSVALSWATYSEPIALNLTVGQDNVIKRPELLDYSIMEAQRILRERIGLYILQQCHAQRTQVKNTTIRNATWDGVNFQMQNSAGDVTKIFQNIGSIMRQHKYYGEIDVIADSVAFKQAQFLQAQGAGNSTNLDFQFKNFSNIWEHPLLTTSVLTTATLGLAIAMPKYSISAIPWIPFINRQGWGDYESYNGGYGTLPDATGLPLTYAVHGYAQRVDASATNGSAQDVKVDLELSVDIAFQVAPLSTANETPIFEFIQQ